MNERTKELVFEARLITIDGITRYASDYEFEKRFTELIVQECISIAVAGNAKAVVTVIKERFGVE